MVGLFRYSWCSERLVSEADHFSHSTDLPPDHLSPLPASMPAPTDLCPLEPTVADGLEVTGGRSLPRLVIGHNVGFDRSFVREQYNIKV